MNTRTTNSVLAFFVAWIVVVTTFAVIVKICERPPEPDFALCPFCSRPVPPSQTDWPLHPDTP